MNTLKTNIKNSLYIPHPMRKLPVREYRKEKTIKVFMPSFVEQKLKNEICDSFRKLEKVICYVLKECQGY